MPPLRSQTPVEVLHQHPDAASSSRLERSQQFLHRFEQRHPAIAARIREQPERFAWLLQVFHSSHFLSDDLLNYPEWMLELTAVREVLSAHNYRARLTRWLATRDPQALAQSLALFRRRELLRIVVRDQAQLATLPAITEELSNLADAITGHALEAVNRNLEARYGTPCTESSAKALFTVLAVGKLGGRELNYSSDIDLIFLYSAHGQTSGPERILNKEFFKKVANELTTLLSGYTPAGQCYRVDLRLRPEGTHGEVCVALPAAKEYYTNRARAWELQMLLKARVAAGDVATGQNLLTSLEPLIYSTTLDFSAIEAMSATRERIGEKMARRSRKSTAINIKLMPGGIRDIEFLVQCLQRLHGNRLLAVKDRGSLPALASLHANNLLSSTEFQRLSGAYTFLRRVEHVLQIENDRQTLSLPTTTRELDRVSALVFHEESGQGSRLLGEVNQHLENVQSIYERIVHAQRPLPYSARRIEEAPDETPSGQVFAGFREALHDHPAELAVLDSGDRVATWAVRLFECAPLLSDQLLRSPELVNELKKAADDPSRRYAFEALAPPLDDIAGLRRFFNRQLFRIQAIRVCLPEAVFHTLDQTSALAEFVIARAYRVALEISLEHARAHASAQKPFAEPQDEMMVVALGRLGMREFDVGSDADLLFILPESESVRHRFWTRVAERLLEILSSYEGGKTLSVDTRLRPNGREGMLVQAESKYVEYFSDKAEAWEGIAYMKARAVAGDTERATRFLTELQQVDWRRYGQGGRSKHELRQMRLRLQREQGGAAPLKAAQGGYYDADFILMYLRLRGAGLFFKSLNTPERIDIVEKMGHLERNDAEFLLRATTHFRALDHALRLVTGHAGGKMPSSPAQRSMVSTLLNLWSTKSSRPDQLEADLALLQANMHRLFESIFAY